MASALIAQTRTKEQHRAPSVRAAAKDVPIYIEVRPLLRRKLVGIGRLVSRLIEALARLRPLRLITTIQGDLARNMRMSNALRCGQEMDLANPCFPKADPDVTSWPRKLLRRPLRPLDESLLEQCAVLYTMLRPPVRRF